LLRLLDIFRISDFIYLRMFNYNLYKQKLELKNKLDTIKKQYLIDKERRKSYNLKQSENYRKRIENFVINMMEKPIIVTDFKGPNEGG
jgi:hypothetical protein